MSRVPSTTSFFSWVRRREWGARASEGTEGASNLAHKVDWFYMGWARAEPGGPCSGDGGMYPPMLKKKALLPRGPWEPVQARDGKNHCPRR